MKVIHVTHGYPPECSGGTESYTRDLVAAQRRAGLDVAVVAGSLTWWPRCGVDELEVDGARVLRVHRDDSYFDHYAKAWHPGVERLLRELLTAEQPDLLHVHHWIRLTSNIVEIADGLGIPSVVTLHDVYASCPRVFRVHRDGTACRRPLAVESCVDCVPRYGHEPAAERAESIELHREECRAELARARAVLIAHARTAALLEETTGFPAAHATVLPLGYRPRFPAGAPPAAPFPRDGEPFRIGHWGHLAPRKGTPVLLRAFAELHARGAPRPVELVLFGPIDTDEARAELHMLAQDLPVRFAGPYEPADLAAAQLHLAVFPTLCFETFGLVLDEAFELGLPCLVTDAGALPDRAGAAALTVPPGDAAALAGALAKVLADSALHARLRSHVPLPPPSVAEHARGVLQIYENARNAPPLGGAAPVDPVRRAAFLLMQRDSAQGGLHPGRGPR